MSDLLQYTTERTVADFDRLRETCGRIPTLHLSLAELTGEDRKGWLQGQATANLRSFLDGGFATFALCQPTGHLVALLDAWHVGDRILLTGHAEAIEGFLRVATERVIMEDVIARDLTAVTTLVSVQGPRASQALGELTALPSMDAGTGEIAGVPVTLCRANRTGLGGWDVWIPEGGEAAVAALDAAIPLLEDDAVEAARIEAGVPQWGTDAGAKTLPPELGPAWENRAVSYNKGCYTGQEVLHRIHARGHTNRNWVGLVAERPIPAGSSVAHALRSEAGLVTSSAFSPDLGYVAGAMLRSEAASDGETVVVTTPAGPVEAKVRRMPLLRMG